jgi:hypothetical protein
MVHRIGWWVALALTLSSFVCFGVMFAQGGGVLIGSLRDDRLPFESAASRISEGRAWGITGIALFVSALVLLWFRPDRREEGPAGPERQAVPTPAKGPGVETLGGEEESKWE